MTLDPAQLDPAARACFVRIERRLRAEGLWEPQFALGLVSTAAQCAAYLTEARALRKGVPPKTAKLLEAQLKRTHRLARQGLRLFAVLPPAELNAEGVDTTIAALCTPLPQLVTPLDRQSA